MFEKGFNLVKEIKSLEDDSTAYIVGGAVRDYFLGRECDDIDIATSVCMDILESHFPTHNIGSNKEFGVLVIEFEGDIFEVSQYREDGEYSDGRRPDDVIIVKDFVTDSKRRDFTINAMAMDEDGIVFDYHGGQEDLKNGIIRCVGDARDRFSEDYLRMIRAVRFATVLDFRITHYDSNIIKDLSANIADIATERIWKELWKMAKCDRFSDAIIFMKQFGMLKYILPEIDCMDQYPHYREHHPEGNVWEHVVGVMKNLDNQEAVVKLGGMFHDIGKPVAYEWFPKKEKYHYIKHDILGLDVFDNVAERIHIPNEIANEIRYSIKGHMRMHQFLSMRDSKCIKLMDSPYWDSLYLVSNADDRARLYCYDWHFWQAFDEKVEKLTPVLEKKKETDSIVDGHFVMDILGVKGGKIVGHALQRARGKIIDHRIDVTTEEGIQKIRKYVSTFK